MIEKNAEQQANQKWVWPLGSKLNTDLWELAPKVARPGFCTYNYDPNNVPKNDYPIEKITHSFWLKTHIDTGKNKEIEENDFLNLLDQYSQLNPLKECINTDFVWGFLAKDNVCFNLNNKSNFKHILWVNDENLYPITVQKLTSIGVEIKNIRELEDKEENIEVINKYIDKGFYGSMVDTLKYMVVKNYGGVALDLNFMLKRNLEDYFEKYSLLTWYHKNFSNRPENSFIAAYAGHPTLKKVVDKVSDMLMELKRGENSALTRSDPTGDTISFWQKVVQQSLNDGGINEIFSPCYDEWSPFDIGYDPLNVGSWAKI